MNGTPFLAQLQSRLADMFRPEQSQNQPPDVQSFVPSNSRTPTILPTIRGILSSQGQPQVAQQSTQPVQQPIQNQQLMSLLQLLQSQQPQQEQQNPLDELMMLLQFIGGGGQNYEPITQGQENAQG